MAGVVVIGLEGQTDLYVVDLGAKTVTPLNPPAGGALSDANNLRTSGVNVVKGVTLAVSVKSAASAASGYLDG